MDGSSETSATRDYAAFAHRLTNPDVPLDPPSIQRHPTRQEWVTEIFGSVEEAEKIIKAGRPALGGSSQSAPSPEIRTRLAPSDYATVLRLADRTGKTKSEIIREAILAYLPELERAAA